MLPTHISSPESFAIVVVLRWRTNTIEYEEETPLDRVLVTWKLYVPIPKFPEIVWLEVWRLPISKILSLITSTLLIL